MIPTLRLEKGITLPDRILERIDRSGGADACWTWQGARLKRERVSQNYGVVWWQGKVRKVHRLMFEAEHGALQEGQMVLHRCDNPPCCNPAHLFAGTALDNARDRDAKGRGRGVFPIPTK